MKCKITALIVMIALSVSSNIYAANREFKFYCQQDGLDVYSKIQHTFISKVFTVKSRYATFCYEANLQSFEDKFFNYLKREFENLNLEQQPANCRCFESSSLANSSYRSQVFKLRSNPGIKLYLIRTFPN